MTFAALPLALLVAACVIPPLILLYFLKLRRQERAVPSTLLWMNAVQDLQANAPFQRLRPNLLLFLQLLTFLFLLAAIAQPEWVGDIEHGSRTILLIDRSASMTTRLDPAGDKRTRLDEAKAQAIAYVEGMDTGGLFNPLSQAERVMVITFSTGANVYSRFTSNKAQLIQTINSITPTHGSTTLKDALALARAHATVTDPEGEGASKKSDARIIMFSDGRIQDISTQVAREAIAYRRIGAPVDEQEPQNAGIVAFAAERNFKELSKISVYARVANYNPFPISATVMFSVGDQLVEPKKIEIPAAQAITSSRPEDGAEVDPATSGPFNATPGLEKWVPGTTGVSFDFADSRGIMLGVELLYRDDLPADNIAYVVVEPAKQLRVALVNSKIFVLETALEGIPFIDQIHRMTGPQFERLQAAGRTAEYDVIIFDDYAPTTLIPGRYLTFGKLPPIEGYGRSGSERKWHLPVAWDHAHPVNYNVNYAPLSALFLPAKIPEAARPILEGDRGVMISEINAGGIHAIVIPFTPRESNLPWDIMVVLLIQNAVDYLGHLGDAVASESSHPGGSIVARLPQNAESITINLPSQADGETAEFKLTPSDPSYTTFEPLELTGLYEMNWNVAGLPEKQTRTFAVNMFDILESDVRSAPAVQFPGDTQSRLAEQGGLRKLQLWPYALLACLFVLTLEWWVYGRRAYV